MVTQATQRLTYLCSSIPVLLYESDQANWIEKPSPDKWSKLEILGHLVDSAMHNHQRLIRAHIERCPWISYDQDQWVVLNRYQETEPGQLISLWLAYNQHVLHVVHKMPEASWSLRCKVSASEELTLEAIFISYVTHLEHHLHQIIQYE